MCVCGITLVTRSKHERHMAPMHEQIKHEKLLALLYATRLNIEGKGLI